MDGDNPAPLSRRTVIAGAAVPTGVFASSSREGWRADSVIVCVPVRDEAVLLPDLLVALAGQVEVPVPMTAAFLFDECRDGSEAVVDAALPGLPFRVARRSSVDAGAPNAGRARRAAMDFGLTLRTGRTAILTTDADSVPATDWVARACAALEQADVVAGRIIRDGPDHRQDRIERYLDALHALRRRIDPVDWDPVPGHHWTGGANLAFRADAYVALGGFAPRVSGEDAAIVDMAHSAGMRVRRDAAVAVHTSARRDGRARGGLAEHLRSLDADPNADRICLAHPADVCWRYGGHKLARRIHEAGAGAGDLAALAAAIDGDPDDLARAAVAAPNAEAFAMRVVPAVPGGERMVSLDEAEAGLLVLLAEHDEEAA